MVQTGTPEQQTLDPSQIFPLEVNITYAVDFSAVVTFIFKLKVDSCDVTKSENQEQ